MARTFNGNLANYLGTTVSGWNSRNGATGWGGSGMSMACWFYTNDHTSATGQGLMSVQHGGADSDTDNRLRLTYQCNITGDPIRCAASRHDGILTTNTADTTTGVTDSNVWHHAACTCTTTGGIAVYLDGGSKGTDSTNSIGPYIAFERAWIGLWANSTGLLQPLDGAVGWPCVWQGVLTDAEVAALAAGAHPYTIRPNDIWAFWPLSGVSTGDEQDVVGVSGANAYLTETGTVGTAESPLVALGNVHYVNFNGAGTIDTEPKRWAMMAFGRSGHGGNLFNPAQVVT